MNYQSVIESAYDRRAWQGLLFDIFGTRAELYDPPRPLSLDRTLITHAWQLGTIKLVGDLKLGIYEVELNHVSLERNRVGIRNLLTTQWRNSGFAGAFQFCYTKDSSELRFSYASETYGFDKDRKFVRQSTDTHRFTYFLGAGHRSRTAIEQFKKLRASELTLQDITEAFSIEAVSKRFFDEYKQNYENLVEHVTGKRMVKVGGKWQEKVTGKGDRKILAAFASFANPEKAVRDYVKKLMGRLVFLQFLQKKGWLGVPKGGGWSEGDREFLRHLYDRFCESASAGLSSRDRRGCSFIDEILEPLFDDINTRRKGDLANPVLGKNVLVPYLNGGLFERDAADKVDFPLPANLLTQLFDFFGAYNFTIDENDPEDAEVGVDPEMLSRIFENLLEDNKDKGAFYTPKSIVGYMCRESLTAYLQTGLAASDTPTVAAFVKTHDASALPPARRADLLQKLRDVKICDPAIGSGAFPMGLLKELFACRKALGDPAAENPATLKREIIENNIYGVDIEKGAVDIARLRFWLALVVDETSPHALPNLDFKIMQGNSLLESFGGVPLDHVLDGGSAAVTQGVYKGGKKAGRKRTDYWQSAFVFDGADAIQEIVRDKNSLFNETDHERKVQLIDRINRNVKAFISHQLDPKSPWQAKIPDGQNDQFFLWHVWFSDVFTRPGKKGFDIVIGNPPYIDSETMTRVMPEIRELYARIYETARGNWDMFIPFVERGIRVLSGDGVFSYIIPNKIVAAKYAETIREELSRHTILNIRDYSRIHVFENAAVYPVVLIVRNVNSESKTKFEIMESEDELQQCVTGSVGGLPWDVFFQPESICAVVRKTFASGVRLYEVSDVSISAAATVSEAYEVKKYLTDEQRGDCFRFINTGTIDPYVSLWGLKKTQYIKGGYETPVISRQHVKAISENRLSQAQSSKIIIAGMSNRIEAFLDDKGMYLAGKSTSIIVGPLEKLKLIVAVLNSKLITFSTNTAYASLKMSGGYLNIGQNEIGAIRIPRLNVTASNEISDLVDAVLAAKKRDPEADTSALEAEIDQLVYKLYGLTDDEIKVVEKAVKK